jgi:hypothetical protein
MDGPFEAHMTLLTRPRTAGEILDDAWRLALADFPLLFALAGLFLVPFFAAVLLLLALPRPDSWLLRLAACALAAVLGALTGVGSGACQEVFRRHADGKPARFGDCLSAALRRGVDHAAARAVLLPAIVLGLGCLVLPGLTIWMACPAVHALIADGKGRRSADLKELGREARFDAPKTAAVVLTRIPLLVLGIINLHVLGNWFLWAVGNLGGFDVSLASFSLTIFDSAHRNWVYIVSLSMLVWLLLVPYFEASNFLLHLDTRTRQEGLDLFYRVRQAFPTAVPRHVGILLVGLMLASRAGAADDPSIAARGRIQGIAQEVKNEDPYRGGGVLARQLGTIADDLEKEGGTARFAWFRRRLNRFAERDRDGALEVLADLDRRLGRMESAGLSKDELRSLLRPPRDDPDEPEPERKRQPEPRRREREDPPEVQRDVDAPPGRGSRSGSASAGPAGDGNVGLMLVGGLLLALVVAAVVLARRNRAPEPPQAKVPAQGAEPTVANVPRPDETPAAALWRRAEEFAAKREYLEALRTLYAAVLALLHRRRFIHFETTRTNGEYVEQVGRAGEAPAALRNPFERLTTLFEWKWYGERACDDRDFGTGRRLAEEVRGLV